MMITFQNKEALFKKCDTIARGTMPYRASATGYCANHARTLEGKREAADERLFYYQCPW